ncbi:lysosomal dipeptide transporter MFSD1-like [Brevipalpus obovatus]|uniref:lysosomal dipeptide transporter MFSD1-like n=1 Tax=Brevipalpus obovatus TaxID=246614 RepID=UPI003D9EF7EA
MVDVGPGDSIANYGPYRCEVCDYSTEKRTDLNAHMLSDEHVKNVQEFHRSNNVMRSNGSYHSNEELHERSTFYENLASPKYRLHRYLVLIVLCMINLGSYYIYDNPGALSVQIERDMNVTNTEYTTLYSMYSWPNVILGLFGGFLIDRVVGVRIGTLLFSFFICLGQLILAFGAYVDHFWIMQLGRFVFGLGGENLSVAVNTYAVSWYKGSELNMVFGLLLSISRLGSTLNFLTMKHVYEQVADYGITGYKCLGVSLLIADGLCVFSLFAGLLMAYFDKRAERILQRDPPGTGEVVKFKDVLYFGGDFWMVSCVCVLYYITIFPFVGLGVLFFTRKFHLDEADADSISSSIYTFSAVAAPLLGLLIDKVGRTITFVFLGNLITLGGHSLLAFTVYNPWIGVSMLGLGYSIIACALWPMIPEIVPEYRLGTAYGVVQCVQNLGFALANLASGAIVDSGGFIALEIFFIGSLIHCLMCVVILFLSDRKKNGTLNISAKKRKALAEDRRRNDLDPLVNDRESDPQSIQTEGSVGGMDDRIRKRRHTDITSRQTSTVEQTNGESPRLNDL